MTIIFIVVISILAAVVGYLVSQLRLRSQVPEARDVPDRIDTDGLVTAVKEAVDAQVARAAQAALQTNKELAGQLIDQRSSTLEEQTKSLLRPVAAALDNYLRACTRELP